MDSGEKLKPILLALGGGTALSIPFYFVSRSHRARVQRAARSPHRARSRGPQRVRSRGRQPEPPPAWPQPHAANPLPAARHAHATPSPLPPHSHPPICSPLGWQQNLKRLGTKVASGGKDSGYQQSKKLIDAKGDSAGKARTPRVGP